MARDRRAVLTHDLLILGVRGRVPLLLLYGVTVTDDQVTAQAYTVRYATQQAQTMTVLEHEGPETRQWRPVRGGLRVRVPKQQAGHNLHGPITLKRPTRRA